jgi:hypothetical protein
MADPERLAAAMLAAIEAQDGPVVETRDANGTITLVVRKRPIAPDRGPWIVPFGIPKKTPGRPQKHSRDQRQLGMAVYEVIIRNPCQRSVDAITNRLIGDRKSKYYEVPFNTLRKRVDALIKHWASVWDLAELYALTGTQPPANPDRELIRELGLQSLQFLSRPFGGRIIDK